MSTILDALRTLQRERESRLGPDALDSQLGVEAPSLPRRSRMPLIAVGGVLVVALSAAVLFGLRDGSDRRDATDPLSASAPMSVPARPTLRAAEASAARAAEASAARATEVSAARAAEASAARAVEAPGVGAVAAPPKMEVEAGTASRMAPIPKLEQPRSPPPGPVTRPPIARPSALAGRDAGDASRSAPSLSSARVPQSPSSPLPSSERPADLARSGAAVPASRRTPAEGELEPLSLTVSQIRWHPDSARRSARVVRADGSFAEVHEGDIVEGVLVRRISTDSIELEVGSERRRLALSR